MEAIQGETSIWPKGLFKPSPSKAEQSARFKEIFGQPRHAERFSFKEIFGSSKSAGTGFRRGQE